MTKLEFEELQIKFATSGKTLKSFLKESGVAYSTYNYWSRKAKADGETLPMAPISFHNPRQSSDGLPSMGTVDVPGVTLAFPNGVRAHFGRGGESVLMDVPAKSMGHVLP